MNHPHPLPFRVFHDESPFAEANPWLVVDARDQVVCRAVSLDAARQVAWLANRQLATPEGES